MLDFEKTTIVFKDYEGIKHKFDVPSYSDLKKAQKKLIDNIDKADEVIIDSLEAWGVNRETLEEFELGHIRKLWDAVLSSKKD